MCGIIGVLSGHGTKGWPTDRVKFIKQGLVVDTLRGFDSTGLFTVEQGKEKERAYWEKDAVTGVEFILSKDFSKMVENPGRFRAMIGHNRAATKGAVNPDNAHPFQEGPITLVHNGTLSYLSGLPLCDKSLKKKKVEVDSHILAHNMAANDISEWYQKMEGAWALVWHDQRDGSLNMLRNYQRPLHVGKVKHEDTLFIASEAEMLAFLAKRVTSQLEDVWQLEPHHLYKWLPESPVMEPIVTKLESSYSAYASTRRGAWRFEDDDDYGWPAGGRRSAYEAPFAQGGRPAATASTQSELPLGTAMGSKVRLCGRLRDIPETMQEDLFEFDMMAEDRLPFEPWVEATENPESKFPPMIGMLSSKNLPALVFGMPASVASDVFSPGSNTLTVRPVGVYHLDMVDDSLGSNVIILCHYCYRGSPPSAYRGPEDDIPFDRAPAKVQRPYHGAALMALGPHGRIPLEAYHQYVKDGCVYCNRTISWLDDEDIEWTDNDQPICHVCLNSGRGRRPA